MSRTKWTEAWRIEVREGGEPDEVRPITLAAGINSHGDGPGRYVAQVVPRDCTADEMERALRFMGAEAEVQEVLEALYLASPEHRARIGKALRAMHRGDLLKAWDEAVVPQPEAPIAVPRRPRAR
jgi:hypothetical protein